MANSNIIVKINDVNGNLEKEFDGEKGKSFYQMAKSEHVDIPFACGVGVCMVCACKVLSGKDAINNSLLGTQSVPMPDDQILTCIAGIKDECFENNNNYEIILQKMS